MVKGERTNTQDVVDEKQPFRHMKFHKLFTSFANFP